MVKKLTKKTVYSSIAICIVTLFVTVLTAAFVLYPRKRVIAAVDKSIFEAEQ